MIALLLWALGCVAVVLLGVRHGVFVWTAQGLWLLVIMCWFVLGAWLLSRRGPRLPGKQPSKADMLRAVREASKRDHEAVQRGEVRP